MGITTWATSWDNLLLPYGNNKGADEPAHLCSLISAFIVRCLDSIIPTLAISSFKALASFYGLWPVLIYPGCKPRRQVFSWRGSHDWPEQGYLSCLTTKPTKWHVCPAKTDQPGHSLSLISRVFAVCGCPGWSESSLWCTCHFVCCVMR